MGVDEEGNEVEYPVGFKFKTRLGREYSFGQVVSRRRQTPDGIFRGLVTPQTGGMVDGNLIGITYDGKGYMDWLKFRFQNEKKAVE